MEITFEKEQELKQEIAPIVSQAMDLIIRNPEQSIEAQEVLKGIKSKQKRITEFFVPLKQAAHVTWKKICDTEASYLDPLKNAEAAIKEKVITFTREEERKQQEIAKVAEAKRQAEERKERERIEEQARKAREAGKVEKAEALEQKAEAVTIAPVFTPPPQPLKAEGSAFKKTWVGKCVSIMDLLKAIVEGKAPVSLIEINESAINTAAKTYKNTMTIPGLRFYEKTQMSVRA